MEQEILSKNARQEPKPKADGYRFYMLKRLKSPHRTTPNPTIFWSESPRHVENSHKKTILFFMQEVSWARFKRQWSRSTSRSQQNPRMLAVNQRLRMYKKRILFFIIPSSRFSHVLTIKNAVVKRF